MTFVNPYNFIHLPPRPESGPLADAPPASHATFGDGLFSGRIPITIRTLTPLLIPDHARAVQSPTGGAKTVSTRTGPTGLPQLLGSSIKGMLRTNFEAATNSRLGVVSVEHNERLAIRRPATSAVRIPGWVYQVTGGIHKICTVEALTDNAITKGGSDFLPAVWVPRAIAAAALGPGELDGTLVEAWIHPLWQPPRNRQVGFHLWRVSAIGRRDAGLDMPSGHELRDIGTRVPAGDPIKVQGIIHCAGDSRGKHDERLVVTKLISTRASVEYEIRQADVTPDAIERWEAVISAYRRAHDGVERGTAAWSALPPYVQSPERWKLTPGRTFFVEYLDGPGFPLALHPAMIGRDAFANPPMDFFPPGHLPSGVLNKLSPAERVFGWTGTGDELSAHRGHLRVGSVVADHAAVPFHGVLPIAALSRPKPAQYRFYLGTGNNATQPTGAGTRKHVSQGYLAGSNRAIRGRKVYLTESALWHGKSGAAEYWSRPGATQSQVDLPHAREFVRDDAAAAQVAVDITNWVAPDTTFSTSLWVENVSEAELGALLRLLSPPAGSTLRMGLGKPLGFGVVHVAVDWHRVELRNTVAIAERYRSIRGGDATMPKDEIDSLLARWDGHVESSDSLRGLREEMAVVARGVSTSPVKYPSLEWWTANDRSGPAPGLLQGLPSLRGDLRLKE